MLKTSLKTCVAANKPLMGSVKKQKFHAFFSTLMSVNGSPNGVTKIWPCPALSFYYERRIGFCDFKL